MSEYILGVHYGHDATLTLMKDGEVVESMQEERISRAKKHKGFPHFALAYIKEKYGVKNFNKVVLAGKIPTHRVFTSFEDNKKDRKTESERGKLFIRAIGMRFPILGFILDFRAILIKWIVWMKNPASKSDKYIREQFGSDPIEYLDHHLAHAWATVPFMPDNKKRLVFTLDGAGDGLSGSINLFDGKTISRLHSFDEKSSLGLLYSGITDILGMKRNEHEFKVMGLAPYAKASSGEKVYEELKKIVWFNEEKMTFESSVPLYRSAEYLTAYDFQLFRFDSLAYGVQKLIEEYTKKMVVASIKKYGIKDIAVSGGVFMNVKANQYILDLEEVSSLVVVPSCGDESLSIGCAYYGYSEIHNGTEGSKGMSILYLGSEYSDEEIKKEIDSFDFVKNSCSMKYFGSDSATTIEDEVAEILAKNGVVGRFKGRAEWGARALGNRSILANPSSRDNVKLINEMIKNRDFWMPFATSLLFEDRDKYLEIPKGFVAPYMSITFNTKEIAHNHLIAALHPYDLTSRPQMVIKEMNPEYHHLISKYKEITGSSGILNTSFNLHGEPNVEKPIDALRTFMNSGLPHLAIGNYLITKK